MEISERKITSYTIGRPGGRPQLWWRMDDLPYYVRVSIMDDALWCLWKQQRIVKEELREGRTLYTVLEQDGEVTQWQLTAEGKYESRFMLTEQDWQQFVVGMPIQQQHEYYITNEQLHSSSYFTVFREIYLD